MRSKTKTAPAHFVCPRCHSRLEPEDKSVICGECDSKYPIETSVVDFRTVLSDNRHKWDAEAFDSAHSRADTGYEDGMQHALNAGIPRFAEEYRQKSKGKLIKDFIAARDPDRILDLGCGNGWFCFELAEICAASYFDGVDVSLFRVNLFRKHITETDTRNKMHVAAANAEALPFPDSDFDVVVLREVIEHLQCPPRAFREISRVLKPGGYVLLSTPTKLMTDFWELCAVLPTAIKRILRKEALDGAHTAPVYDSPLSAEELENVIKKSGLKKVFHRRVILLPHESYLQFIPKWILRPMVFTAGILEKIPPFRILGLHHVVFLKKENT